MNNSSSFDIEITARAKYLSLVRSLVEEAAETKTSLSRTQVEDFKVAVSEATTNAIEAHARASSDETIKIRCTVDSERVEFRIADKGCGFYPDQIQPLPEPDDPDRLTFERGLGIYLMKVLADEVEIQSNKNGTEVTLVIQVGKSNTAVTE
ncbi:MAG: ATP-binding protein [Acidimicrobiia bacterium]|nr:ATP-binding protein [Acidimicrobiia bacterium]MYC57608.1 ATP-binding protein [Acidimicrobiia bacterium]MYI31261.1 ATP-binding protein [Acidimicrobiia bacterium]